MASFLDDAQFSFKPIVEEEPVATFDLGVDLTQTQSQGEEGTQAQGQAPILQPHTHKVVKVPISDVPCGYCAPANFIPGAYVSGVLLPGTLSFPFFQDLTFLPQVPRDGTLQPLQMAAFYKDYAHPEALWETLEKESGFEQDVVSQKVLLEFIGNLPDYMDQKPVNNRDVSLQLHCYIPFVHVIVYQ